MTPPDALPHPQRRTRDRAADIALFYAREAESLHRAVARSVAAPAAMVEDACSYAWCQLLRHDEIELGPGGFWWLYVVAKREVFRLSGRARREEPAGEPSELPGRAALLVEDVGETVQRRADHDARVRLLDTLSERRRRMLILQAAGFSYEEIAQICGDSLRTVERQLLRGKRGLVQAQQAQAAKA
jgi:RNA polymerase sigma factor (sigma-70 family)